MHYIQLINKLVVDTYRIIMIDGHNNVDKQVMTQIYGTFLRFVCQHSNFKVFLLSYDKYNLILVLMYHKFIKLLAKK